MNTLRLKSDSLVYPLLLVTVVFIGCDSGTDIGKLISVGRRDYTWKADTLHANPGGQIYLFGIWGSSPDNVWAVGSADASNIAIWHYDGSIWSVDSSRLSPNLTSIIGFAANDIWICDSPGGGIWHFDGSGWSKQFQATIPGYSLVHLNCIWGLSSDNIYCVGAATNGPNYRAIILHKGGNNWSILPLSSASVDLIDIKSGANAQGRYYITGISLGAAGDTNRLYQFENQALALLYSSRDSSRYVSEIAGDVYVSTQTQIFKPDGDQLQLLKDFSGESVTLGMLWGRSEKDIFTPAIISGAYGLAEYNGTDIVELYAFQYPIMGMMVFKDDIFILSNDGVHPIVVRGSLPH